MLPKSFRSLAYFSLGSGFAAGYMLNSLLAYAFRDWRWFLRFTALFGLFYIPYYWYCVTLFLWSQLHGFTKSLVQCIQNALFRFGP